MNRGAQSLWLALGFLLVTATWVFQTGRSLVEPLRLDLLETLARSRNLTTSSPPSAPNLEATLGRWLSMLPGDPLFWTGLFGAILSTTAVVLMLVGLTKCWKGVVPATLTAGYLAYSGAVGWSRTELLPEFLALPVLALGLLAAVNKRLLVLAGAAWVLALIQPAWALCLLIVLTALAWHLDATQEQAPRCLGLSTLTTLLALPWLTKVTIEPSLGVLNAWSLLSAIWLFAPKRTGDSWPRILVASLLLGSMLTNSAEWGSALMLGYLWQQFEPQWDGVPRDENLPPGVSRWMRFSLGRLWAWAALAVFVLSVLPGEQRLNRQVLIPAQKAKLGFEQLLWPFSLEQHLVKFEQQAWRKNVPFPQLSEADVAIIRELSQAPSSKFAVLTVDHLGEDRTLSLVYALASQKNLVGWVEGQVLSGPMLVCKRRQENILAGGPTLVFRDGPKSELQEAPPEPSLNQPEQFASVDFQRILATPIRKQSLGPSDQDEERPRGYRWFDARDHFNVVFPSSEGEVILPDWPGSYRLVSLADPNQVREFKLFPEKLELSLMLDSTLLPSRSVVPMTVVLGNEGLNPITAEQWKGFRLETDQSLTFSSFWEPLGEDFILFPGEEIHLEMTLITPEPEGLFGLQAWGLSVTGRKVSLELESSERIRTWRRLPPVGTWVEPE